MGDGVADLCQKLDNTRGIGIKEIAKELKGTYTGVQIKKCLVTLLQHRFIKNTSKNNESPFYSLDVPFVLKFIYQPLILETFSAIYGETGVRLLQMLFLHGSMPLESLVDETVSDFGGDQEAHNSVIAVLKDLIKIGTIRKFDQDALSLTETDECTPISIGVLSSVHYMSNLKRSYGVYPIFRIVD